jgi:hypothetical protein
MVALGKNLGVENLISPWVKMIVETQGWKNMSQESEAARKESWKKAYNSKPLLECPHCGKTGKNRSAMSRWHFDNCSNTL